MVLQNAKTHTFDLGDSGGSNILNASARKNAQKTVVTKLKAIEAKKTCKNNMWKKKLHDKVNFWKSYNNNRISVSKLTIMQSVKQMRLLCDYTNMQC